VGSPHHDWFYFGYKLHVPAELARRRAVQLAMADFPPSRRALVEAGKGPHKPFGNDRLSEMLLA
jgi:hypothetical protein